MVGEGCSTWAVQRYLDTLGNLLLSSISQPLLAILRTYPRFSELILSDKHIAIQPHPHAAGILNMACRCPAHLHTAIPKHELTNQGHHENPCADFRILAML